MTPQRVYSYRYAGHRKVKAYSDVEAVALLSAFVARPNLAELERWDGSRYAFIVKRPATPPPPPRAKGAGRPRKYGAATRSQVLHDIQHTSKSRSQVARENGVSGAWIGKLAAAAGVDNKRGGGSPQQQGLAAALLRGVKHGQRPIADIKHDAILILRGARMPLEDVAKAVGVSRTTVSRVTGGGL